MCVLSIKLHDYLAAPKTIYSRGYSAGMVSIQWERLEGDGDCTRAKIHGGWLVRSEIGLAYSITFVPDPRHAWG